jgi:hypothetical protein
MRLRRRSARSSSGHSERSFEDGAAALAPREGAPAEAKGQADTPDTAMPAPEVGMKAGNGDKRRFDVDTIKVLNTTSTPKLKAAEKGFGSVEPAVTIDWATKKTSSSSTTPGQ